MAKVKGRKKSKKWVVEPVPVSKERLAEIHREGKSAPEFAPLSRMPPVPAANGATACYWGPVSRQLRYRPIIAEGGSSPGVFTLVEAYAIDEAVTDIYSRAAELRKTWTQDRIDLRGDISLAELMSSLSGPEPDDGDDLDDEDDRDAAC